MSKHLVILLAGLLASQSLFGQETFRTRSSPLAMASVRYKNAYIKVTYSQPLKRGREIFGKLVPYEQVWRTGANEATEITFTSDVIINEQVVKAGTYSIFTIPGPSRWTIILNSDLGLWGAYNYNSALDVLRIDVPVIENSVFYEAFTIAFEHGNEVADLLMMWDKVKIQVPMKFITQP